MRKFRIYRGHISSADKVTRYWWAVHPFGGEMRFANFKDAVEWVAAMIRSIKRQP